MTSYETGLDAMIAQSTNTPQRLTFYNDTIELLYDDPLHIYYQVIDGVRVAVPSASKITEMVHKEALVQWAANMTVVSLQTALEIAPETPRDQMVKPCTVQDMITYCEAARLYHRKVKEDAADIGKLAHGFLEGYLKSLIRKDAQHCALLPDNVNAVNCIHAGLDWMEKHNVRPLQCEQAIFSREHGFTGRFDWIAMVTACGDPKCCPFTGDTVAMGDFKSSSGLYPTYRAQLAAYRAAWEEEHPDKPIGVCILLRLGKYDGEFETLTITQEEFDTDFDGFLGMLSTYNWERQLYFNQRFAKDVIRAEKKAAKAAEKANKPKRQRKSPRRAIIRDIGLIPVEETADTIKQLN